MTPMSMAEIHADKDQLRAEFAMSTRRLEMSVEQMKAKTSTQLAEIGKKSDAIGRLKMELGEKAAALLAAEAKVNSLTEELQATQNELTARSEGLRSAELKLDERAGELSKLGVRLNDSALTSDSQKVELAASHAQVEVLKGQVETYEQELKAKTEQHAREVKSLQSGLDEQIDRSETSGSLLAEERIKTDAFAARIKNFENQLVQQTTEAEILARRVQELLARQEEHERLAAERETTAAQLREQAGAAQKSESDLRGELAAQDTRHRVTLETINTEKAHTDEQLKAALAERERAQLELAKVKRDAEAAWNAERMETAVMRERINDVAAEVARLTATLEGPNSPIESILAAETNGAHDGDTSLAPMTNGAPPKGTLADRIRALQSRRARAPHPG
jgi:chromosome segregation ATPase